MSDKKKIVKESKVVVTRSFRKSGAEEGKEEVTEETLEVREFVTTPAETGLALGLTLNLGGYETARVDVRLYVPCYREEIVETYAFAEGFVKERIQSEVDAIRKSRDNTSNF